MGFRRLTKTVFGESMDLPRMIELLTVPELTSAPSLGHGRIARLILGLREVLIPLVRPFQKTILDQSFAPTKKIRVMVQMQKTR
jgi:hypothetical protein